MRIGFEQAWAAGFFDGEGNVSYLEPNARWAAKREEALV